MFLAIPRIVPPPCSYSRRIFSNSSTLALLSTRPPLGRLSPKRSTRYMVFSKVGPNQSIEWGQIRISKSSAELWKEREVIFSQFAGLAQVGQNVCLSRRRSLRPKPFWLSKSDRLDYLRYADFPLQIPISRHGLLPGCRQLAQNLIFTLPRTPFAQVKEILKHLTAMDASQVEMSTSPRLDRLVFP